MIPLSKIKAKYIKSLQLKKFRDREKLFIVEGRKSVMEFINSDLDLELLAGTEEFYQDNLKLTDKPNYFLVGEKELSGLGSLKKNNAAIGVFSKPEVSKPDPSGDGVWLALDGINDPGNLGTIIRTADWFGIQGVILNDESVDVYNPKVISASKGSLSRIKVYQHALPSFLKHYQHEVIAADMTGTNLAKSEPLENGLIIMGNESHGISTEVASYITRRVTIPALGKAESLNVGVATGIVCYQLLAKY